MPATRTKPGPLAVREVTLYGVYDSNSDPTTRAGRERLPIAFRGQPDAAERFAADNGYEWKQSDTYIFRGYYCHPQTGNCLLPDIP